MTDATEIDPNADRCGACGEMATHEVQPPNPDRDDYLPVCDTHAKELRPISADVRQIDPDGDHGD